MKKNKVDSSLEKKRKIIRTKITIDPTYSAAVAIDTLYGDEELLDINTLIDELSIKAKQHDKGNLKEIERMLFMQAKTLEYVFYDTLKKLISLDTINQIAVFTDIAFKAQTLSRRTLMALAELKQPRHATFIKQQNNAINQQINNETKTNFKKSKKVSNELLSEVNHAALDSRGAPETITINTNLETMESIDRP